jgi:subtilisin-like proprotein convertase family protein
MKKLLPLLLLCVGLSHSAAAQTFSSNTTGPIEDNAYVDYPIPVSALSTLVTDTANFGLEQVCLNLTHTYDGDLRISLIAPDGMAVVLINGIGGGDENFTNTCLRADAANNFVQGSAPFTGTFKPTGQMGLVNNGQNPNGTWTLRVEDLAGGDTGTFLGWSIEFGSNPASYFSFQASDLPIVVIHTHGQDIVDDPKILADMGIIFNGAGVRNHLSDSLNHYNGQVGIEIRGNYSASLPQKPYAIELQDVNGTSIKASLLGMPAESDWVLLANYNDKSFARNVIPFHLFEEMGHYAVRCRLVDVVINDEYRGIYLLGEKIKRDSARIDIAKLNPQDISGQDVTGGYIVKIDYWNNDNSWLLSHSPIGFPGLDVHMVYYYPKPEDLMIQQKAYIQDFIYDFEEALYGPDFDDPELGYRKFISVSSFIDYFIINELARNVDGFKKSRFFYKDKDHADGTYRKLKAGPVWDFDWALKDIDWNSEDGSGFMYGNVAQDVNAPGWYIRLLEDPAFRNELRCRYDDLRRSILSNAYLYAKVDSVANVVHESQAWHFQTWGNLGVATGTPEVEAPSQTYAEETQRLKDWFARRLVWLDANMPGTLTGCSMTGVEELGSDPLPLEAYPNPFRSALSVHIGAQLQGTIAVQLTDNTGRIVRSETTDAPLLTDNNYVLKGLDQLQSGVYFLRVSAQGRQATVKVMK